MSSSYRYNINNNINKIDLHLIGNPEITNFKSVYRRHVDFEKVIHVGDINTQCDILCDFLLNVSVLFEYSITGTASASNVPTKLIENIYYTIGNDTKIIEHLTGEYIEYYNQLRLPLTLKSEYKDGGDVVIGNNFNIMSHTGGVFKREVTTAGNFNSILPIPFSFTINPGNAFPLFLLKVDERPIFNFTQNLVPNTTISSKKLMYEGINIIELSEKQRFYNSKSEYIYTRVYKYNVPDNTNETIEIESSYGIIKSFIWNTSDNHNYNIKINDMALFNTFEGLEAKYFTRYFPMRAGLLGTGRNLDSSGSYIIATDTIHYYTFGLKDNIDGEYTPNGTVDSNKNSIKIISKYFTDTTGSKSIYIVTNNIITFEKNKKPVFTFVQPNTFQS